MRFDQLEHICNVHNGWVGGWIILQYDFRTYSTLAVVVL